MGKKRSIRKKQHTQKKNNKDMPSTELSNNKQLIIVNRIPSQQYKHKKEQCTSTNKL